MYLFNSFKIVYWTKFLACMIFFCDTILCQDEGELRKMFTEYGFVISNDISLNIDLPYWGQSHMEVEKSCLLKKVNVTTRVRFYNQGMEDAVEFLCDKDKLREYKILIKCFKNSEVVKIFNTCQAWREIAIDNFNNSKALELNITQCSIEDVYQACTSSMLQSLPQCGKNASTWFDLWWRKMNYYYHLSISCISEPGPKDDDDSDEWSIILGIILAVTACLLVVGIIVFVVFLFSRRKYNSNNDDDPGHPRGPRGFGQRREVPPPYALVVDTPGENASESDASTSALRLVDRENRTVVETEARLYDGNVTSSSGNGLILPPPYSGQGPPPDFDTQGGVADSDKEDELMSLETGTTRCSSVNLQAADSALNISAHFSTTNQTEDQPVNHISSRRESPTVDIATGEMAILPIKNPSLSSVDTISPSQERSKSSLV